MADRGVSQNSLRVCCGVYALQKKRLEQTLLLIEHYSLTSENLADPGRAHAILEKAKEQRTRIENWLAAHSHGAGTPARWSTSG